MKKSIVLIILAFSFIFVTGCQNDSGDKPTILIRGATSCPHCVDAIPVFEEQIFDVYKDKVDIYLNTLSPTGFDTTIPQTTGSNFEFEKHTGTPCDYIPAWAIIDIKGNAVNYSCGGEKELSDLLESLESLF